MIDKAKPTSNNNAENRNPNICRPPPVKPEGQSRLKSTARSSSSSLAGTTGTLGSGRKGDGVVFPVSVADIDCSAEWQYNQ